MGFGLLNRFMAKLRRKKYRFVPVVSENLDDVVSIAIETITACNLRCSYCPNSKFDRGLPANKKYMERSLYKKIIDELASLDWKGEVQPILFGEPLLDERIVELVAYARKKLPESSINFFTNGELLTLDRYHELRKAGVTIFTATQHLEKQPKAIREIIDWRQKNGDDGVLFIYKPLHRMSSRGGLIEVPYVLYKTTTCPWPAHNISINYAGDVVLCCNDYLAQVKLGDVNSQSLMEIWNDEKYQKIRNDLKHGILGPDICKNCVYGLPYAPSLAERISFHIPTIAGAFRWLRKKTKA